MSGRSDAPQAVGGALQATGFLSWFALDGVPLPLPLPPTTLHPQSPIPVTSQKKIVSPMQVSEAFAATKFYRSAQSDI